MVQRFALLHVVRLGPLLLAAMLALLACGGSRSAPRRSEPRPAQVAIENKHWLDVVVYVEYGGRRARVGQVTAAGEAAFPLSSRVLGTGTQIRLIAAAIGSNDGVTTRPIFVRPGQRVDWTLERDLSTSTISVR